MQDTTNIPGTTVHDGANLRISDALQKRNVEVQRMQYGDVSTAVKIMEHAFEDDPFHDYLNHTPDSPPAAVSRFSRNFDATLMWTDFTYSHQAWTVNHGDAVVGYQPARSTWGIKPKILDFVIGSVILAKNLFTLSKEQKNRHQELREKHGKATEDVLGNNAKEVINLQILATASARQGHGYASALVKKVLEIAADEGRITSLTSSNTKNNGFYESLGFVARKTITLGDENATWDKAPVVLTLMTHEPKPQVISSRLLDSESVKFDN